jgi:protein tyrosine/serine phosphatase
LKKLDEEVIILELKENIKTLPLDLVKKYKIESLNKNEIKVFFKKKHTINDLVKDFDFHSIEISSFRNDSSRLEQLFINLTK